MSQQDERSTKPGHDGYDTFERHPTQPRKHDTGRMATDLIDVRCPYTTTGKSGTKEWPCNRLAVRVSPGSKGEAHCNRCGRVFAFDVAAD